MNPFATVIKALRASWVSQAEVRAETFFLGGRHQGRVLEGARSELKTPNISFRRTILLQAVIRSQARPAPA